MRSALFALLVACGSSHAPVPDTASGTPITVTLTNHPAAAATYFIVGYQDGDGPWHPAPPPEGDDYTFYVQSDRWGFAHTCASTLTFVELDFFTVSERTSLTEYGGCDVSASDNGTVTGTVSGLPATTLAAEYELYYAGQFGPIMKSQSTGTFALQNTSTGSHDLALVHTPPTTSTPSNADGVAIVRDVVAPTANPVAIDWSTAGIATATVSVDAPGATAISAYSNFETANQTSVQLGYGHCTHTPCVASIAGLPASLTIAGDAITYTILIHSPPNTVTIDAVASTFGPVAITAPAPIASVMTTSQVTTPYPRIGTTWSAYPNAVGYFWAADDAQVSWSANFGSAYVGASPSFVMPDLSQLPNWNTSLFAFVAPGTVQGGVAAYLVDVGPPQFPPDPTQVPTPPAQTTTVATSWSAQLP